jgi:hypothetical protein
LKPGTREPLTTNGKIELRQVQLVDGGYFDNSGILTALELIRAMRSAADRAGIGKSIQINLVVLSAAADPEGKLVRATELTAPIEGLLQARVATGRATVNAALRSIREQREGTARTNGLPDTVRKVELKDIGYPLPLGWRLSQMTRLLMAAQRIRKQGCEAKQQIEPIETSTEPACTVETIYRQLQQVID